MKQIFTFFFLSYLISGHAQTFGIFPTFDIMRNYYKPAFTGVEGKARMYAAGSYQHRLPAHSIATHSVRYETNGILDFSSPVYKRNTQQLAIGLNYSSLKYDVWSIHDMRLNVSYMHALGKHRLSYGGNLDIIHDYVDYRGLNDVTAPYSDQTINAGFGAAFHHKSGFYLGASANTIIHNHLTHDEAGYIYKIYRSNYFFNTGMDIRLGNKLTLKPSVMLYNYGTWQVSGNLLLEFMKHFQAGVFYNSTLDQPGIRLGYQGKRIGAHYTYSTPSHLYSVTTGIHTGLLSYSFNQ